MLESFRNWRALAWLASAVTLWLTAAAPAQANPVVTENVESRLVSEVTTVRPGETFWVALHQKIRPGWFTYWRNPGDSGLPAQIEWTLPAGMEAGEIHWPAPTRKPVAGLMNYGYSDELALLVPITASDALDTRLPATLSAKAVWLVCEEICIPEEGSFTTAVATAPADVGGPPSGLERDGQWTALFEQARAALPAESPWPARFNADADRIALQIDAPGLSGEALRDVYFFADEHNLVSHAAPQSWQVTPEGLSLLLTRGPLEAAPTDRLGGLVSITESVGGETLHQTLRLQAALDPALDITAAAPATAGLSLWTAIAFAILGGMLLNLMPCVLPVLSLKALSLAQKGGDPAKARPHGLAYAGGVLSCFALLAAALLVFQAAGAQIGWGFQLQSPTVVAVLAYLMFALGLSLSGVYEIGARLMGVGGSLAGRGGLTGSYLTGVLTAVVASPCTAPFMGAALGFALTQPAPTAVAVILALGAGLALPYLALSFSPPLVRLLPRPGPWMNWFRQVLAIPMYGTAVWLLWVLWRQAGVDGLAFALGGLALIGLAAWLFGRGQTERAWLPRPQLISGAAVAVALGLAFAPAPVTSVPTAVQGEDGAMPFELYTPARLAELRGEGRAVFINATAAWCITCLVNDKVVLTSDAVVNAFAEHNVAYLKADWTNRDADVTALLNAYGRSGVPLYLYFAPEAARTGGPLGGAIALPQILTEAIVLRELEPGPTAIGLRQTRN